MSESMIGDFIIEEKLFESEWGELFRVKPLHLKRTYALKLAKEGPAEQRLITERKVLEKLGSHPNITEIYFAGNHHGRPFIVEELASSSLRKLLDSDATLSYQASLHIIKQVAEATKFAHSHGVFHQDLKPENILLNKQTPGAGGLPPFYDVAICDFGLASQVEDRGGVESSLDDAGRVAGTVQYLSPEQRHGDKVDHRSDLYTIGLIFYELLTGKKATIGFQNPTEIKKDLPTWVDDFILQCLRPEPKDRFQTAGEMLAAIKLSTSAPIVLPPTKMALFRETVNQKCRKGLGILGTVLKHTLLTPLYIIFLPFFLGFYLISYFNKQRMGEMGFIIAAAIFAGYYFWGVPELAELNLRHVMAQEPASGTILYYSSGEDIRGFNFVDARRLPEPVTILIATPEITNGDFRPKFTLSEDGKTFYYTTPHGLVKIDLTKASSSTDFRHNVVRSEVFNYFSDLAFVDGKLLARLKDETWEITSEGRMQQTTVIMPTQQVLPISNGDYSIDQDGAEIEVQFSGKMLGNFNLGSSTEIHAWLPQTICLFRGE
jgi:serine/threonine protein kinase